MKTNTIIKFLFFCSILSFFPIFIPKLYSNTNISYRNDEVWVEISAIRRSDGKMVTIRSGQYTKDISWNLKSVVENTLNNSSYYGLKVTFNTDSWDKCVFSRYMDWNDTQTHQMEWDIPGNSHVFFENKGAGYVTMYCDSKEMFQYGVLSINGGNSTIVTQSCGFEGWKGRDWSTRRVPFRSYLNGFIYFDSTGTVDSNDYNNIGVYNQDKGNSISIRKRWEAYISTYEEGGTANIDEKKKIGHWKNYAGGITSTTTRKGYTLDGWYADISGRTNGNIKWYNADGSVNKNTESVIGADGVRVYAHWIANTYLVTLDNQGGGSGDISSNCTYEKAMTPIKPPKRTGYTFNGYFSGINGGGEKYYNIDGSSAKNYDLDYNTTLYAYWTANAYTITLDSQNATESGTAQVTAVYDSPMPTLKTLPQKQGYTYDGYYTEPDGNGTKYYLPDGTSANIWNLTSDTTLYAKWRLNQTHFILDNGGATKTGTRSIDVMLNSNLPPITVPQKDGHTFKGYFQQKDGQGGKYYNELGTSNTVWVALIDTVTIYAYWDAIPYYTITLDNQGATLAGTTSVKSAYGGTLPDIIIPQKTGYTFGGYFSALNGGGTQYYTVTGASAQAWNQNNDFTLYAKWTADIYTVTLNNQDATSAGTTSVKTTYGAALPSIIVPQKTGYTFEGYYLNTEGGGMQYYSATGVSVHDYDQTSNIMLYAKWTINNYTVTLDNQEGTTTGTASVNITYGASMPEITIPTKIGYNFGGYYSIAEGKGTQYYTETGASAHIWDIDGSSTLYAKWISNDLTVSISKETLISCQNDNVNINFAILTGVPTRVELLSGKASAVIDEKSTFLSVSLSKWPSDKYHIVDYIVFTDINGNKLNPIRIILRKGMSNLIKQVFPNVLVIKNPNNTFTSYQWYKIGDNGDELPLYGEINQEYFARTGLSGSYFAKMTNISGDTVYACPETFYAPALKSSKKASVKIYPNPTTKSFIVSINDLDESDLNGAVMQIFNNVGVKVYETAEVKTTNTVELPAGQYIGKITLTTGKSYSYQVIVKQ